MSSRPQSWARNVELDDTTSVPRTTSLPNPSIPSPHNILLPLRRDYHHTTPALIYFLIFVGYYQIVLCAAEHPNLTLFPHLNYHLVRTKMKSMPDSHATSCLVGTMDHLWFHQGIFSLKVLQPSSSITVAPEEEEDEELSNNSSSASSSQTQVISEDNSSIISNQVIHSSLN